MGGTAPSCLAVDKKPCVASSGSPSHQGPLQVCSSLQGVYALLFLFKGRPWVGAWKVFGGLAPPPTLLTGPSLPKHPAWRARPGGCRSQGCHGCPTTRLLCTGLSWLPYVLGSCARGSTIFPGTFPKLIYC